MEKVIKLDTLRMPEESPEIDDFFNEVKLQAKKAHRTKFIVISIQHEESDYNQAINCFGVRSAESIAALEIAKEALIQSMKG